MTSDRKLLPYYVTKKNSRYRYNLKVAPTHIHFQVQFGGLLEKKTIVTYTYPMIENRNESRICPTARVKDLGATFKPPTKRIVRNFIYSDAVYLIPRNKYHTPI